MAGYSVYNAQGSSQRRLKLLLDTIEELLGWITLDKGILCSESEL